MFKFIIFMCAVLFASATNGSFISETLKIERKNSLELIDKVISDVKQEMDTFTQRKQIIGTFVNETIDFTDETFAAIANFIEEVTLAIDYYEDKEKVGEKRIPECIKKVDLIIRNINNATIKTGECVMEKMETKLVEITNTAIANDLLKLNQIKEEAEQCGDSAVDVTSTVKAILCVNAAASKATWNSIKILRTLNREKVNRFESVGAKEALTNCKSINKFKTFQRDLLDIVYRVILCIENKMHPSMRSTVARTELACDTSLGSRDGHHSNENYKSKGAFKYIFE